MNTYRINGVNNNLNDLGNMSGIGILDRARAKAKETYNKVKAEVKKDVAKVESTAKKEIKIVKAEVKKDVKKLEQVGKTVVTKAGLAVPRNAFLLLVKLNVRSLAYNMQKLLDADADKLKEMWQKLGGDFNTLKIAIGQGIKHKRLGGIGVVAADDVAAIATAVAAAVPILIVAIKAMKSKGIKQQSFHKEDGGEYTSDPVVDSNVDDSLSLDGTSSSDMIDNKSDQIDKNGGVLPTNISSSSMKFSPVAVVGGLVVLGAGIYLATNNKIKK
jgi:hypothetical protein